MTEFILTELTDISTSFYGKEAVYRDCIAQVMRDDGWFVQTEVRTNLGIADLVARRGTEIWVIEVKLFGDNNSVAHACGQLLFYTNELPFTKRLIAIPEKVKFKFDSALNSYGIDLFWFTNYSIKANKLFEKESRLNMQRDQIEKCRSMLAELAANMEGFDWLENDPKTDQLWDALAGMMRNAAIAIDMFCGRAPNTGTHLKVNCD